MNTTPAYATSRPTDELPADMTNTASPEEALLWSFLEQAAQESARVKRLSGFDFFDKHVDLYVGRHYPDTLPSYRPPVVINELRSLILQEANDLSDAAFRPYIVQDPFTGQRDEQSERALRALWTRQKVDLKIINAVVWATTIGTGFLRVWWDPNDAHGMGDVQVEDIDPRSVLPDPDAQDEQDWAYVIYESILDLGEIRRLFPKQGHRVTPDAAYSERDPGWQKGDRLNPNLQPGYPYRGPLSEGDSLLGSAFPGYKKARARILDCFVKDGTIIEETEEVLGIDGLPLKDEAGNPKFEVVTKMKYPNGRRIVGCHGIILFDDENPNPPLPSGALNAGLVRVVLEPTLGAFWGVGFTQQTGELQLAADKMESSVVENAIRLNNGIVVAEGNTGVNWNTFASIPGQIVQINAGSKFSIMYPNPMPQEMVTNGERLLNMQRRVLGFTDPRAGGGDRGNVSADMTEIEISQSQSGTRLRAKHLYNSVQNLAQLMFSLMAERYTVPRVIPAVEGGKLKAEPWRPIDTSASNYSVYVDPTAFQILSRSALRKMSMMLFKMSAIDRQAVLESIGWPHWEEVSERVDKNEQAMMMAKLQARSKGRGK